MPTPNTVGRPSEWMVRDQAANNGAQLKARAALNEIHPCQHPGCSRKRAGVSRYCGPHRDLASRRGDPLSRWPRRNELVLFKHAVGLYLSVNPEFSKRVSTGLRELERRHTPPASFQLRYSDMHRKLPQAAKAKGLLANWIHKDGKTYADCVVHALAVSGWASVFYNGLSENRQAFVKTAAGSLLGDIRGFGKLRYSTSGATQRFLGRDFIAHAEAIYGKAFWSNAVSTQDGQDMTLLSYVKAALRIADLHP